MNLKSLLIFRHLTGKKVGTSTLIGLCIVSLAIVSGRGRAAKRYVNEPRAIPAAHTPTTTVITQALPAIAVYAAPGMRVTINAAQIDNISRTLAVNCVLRNHSSETVEDLELVMLDFTAAAKIYGVFGRKFNGTLRSGEAANLSFTSDQPLKSNHSLLLTVSAIRGASVRQEVDTSELLQGLLALKASGAPPSLIVRESASQQARIDPNFCHTVFRIAHNLTKADGIPVAGYTCSQGRESFLIGYRSE